MSGKGDTPRPMSITPETFAQRYPMERVKAPEGHRYVAGKGWVPVEERDHQYGPGRYV